MKKLLLKKAPMMLLVVACLILGILTGWFRLGFDLPVSKVFLHHGALMTGSFLGTVILIERIVTFKKKWLFAFPVINAFSLLFFYLNWNQIAFSCLIIGSLGLVFVFYLINLKQSDLAHQVMWVGSAMWLVGNTHLLIFQMYANSILWWMGFLLLTVVGERLELTRFLPLSQFKKNILLLLLLLFVISCVLPFHMGGQLLTGISLTGIGIWLLLFDIIRKSIKKPGIHRFSAITLSFGYGWLVVAGIFYLFNPSGIISYDALIHSFFLGFVFSMIFAHAPIILPGVLGLVLKPYHPILFLWVALFQISLLIRIMGDLLSLPIWKQYGGLANGLVILAFLVNLIVIVFLRGKNNLKEKVSVSQAELETVPGPVSKIKAWELMLIANHLCGPSYVFMELALAYWGMITERVYETTSVTVKPSRIYRTELGRFSYRRSPFTYYSLGIRSIELGKMQLVMIASSEKAICVKIAFTSEINIRSVKQTMEFLISD